METFTLKLFCEAHHISRATFYKLLKEGRAPRIARIGRKILISKESAAAWRAKLDAEAV